MAQCWQRIPTVSYLKRQMNDEAKKYGGSGEGDSLLGWLALLPETLGKVTSIEVESIRYDGNRSEVRLQAKSSNFQHFETAREKLDCVRADIVLAGALSAKAMI